MTTPITPLTPPPDDDRPVMGDHPELEDDETVRSGTTPADDTRTRLLVPGLVVPGLVVLVIVVLVILYLALWS